MTDSQPKPLRRPDDSQQQTGSAQAPRTGGGSHRMLLIVLAVCLCVAAVGVSIAMFASPGGSGAGYAAGTGNSPAAATPQVAQPTAPVASSRATVKPGGTSDGLAKSALRWPPGRARQILRWDAGPGGKTLAAVAEQMGTAMQSAGLRMYAVMRLACAQLASDVSTARAGPPIPDDAMQRLYARALAGLSRAAADCHTAISIHEDGEDTQVHANGPLLSRSRVEFAAASTKLYRATGEIESLHH